MAKNLQAYTRFASLIDGDEVKMGDLEVPAQISVTGLVFRKDASIAASGNATLYNDELSGFEVLGIQSDYTVRCVLTDSAANTFSITIKGTGTANQFGPVTALWSDDTASTSTQITKVEIYNDWQTAETAIAKVLLVK